MRAGGAGGWECNLIPARMAAGIEEERGREDIARKTNKQERD